jgi:hypothetical protein
MAARPLHSLPALPLIGALLLPASAAPDADESSPELSTAVPSGTLMLAGGAIEPKLYVEFVRLAGGADAKIVCVPTAAEPVEMDETRAYVRENAAQVGATPDNMTVLHTRDSLVADTDSFWVEASA